MQLDPKIQIAGEKTVGEWITLRIRLLVFTDAIAWEEAYNDFFIGRLKDKYFDSIEAISKIGKDQGEGFSIMAIICSIIEFLESTYLGKNYRYWKHGDPPINPTIEYGKSSPIFKSFLVSREPFRKEFTPAIAKEFYEDVRCGLLHGARTNGKWQIWAVKNPKGVIHKTAAQSIIYRNEFYKAIQEYVNIHYKTELLANNDRKLAFIRKFDNLCEE